MELEKNKGSVNQWSREQHAVEPVENATVARKNGPAVFDTGLALYVAFEEVTHLAEYAGKDAASQSKPPRISDPRAQGHRNTGTDDQICNCSLNRLFWRNFGGKRMFAECFTRKYC